MNYFLHCRHHRQKLNVNWIAYWIRKKIWFFFKFLTKLIRLFWWFTTMKKHIIISRCASLRIFYNRTSYSQSRSLLTVSALILLRTHPALPPLDIPLTHCTRSGLTLPQCAWTPFEFISPSASSYPQVRWSSWWNPLIRVFSYDFEDRLSWRARLVLRGKLGSGLSP